jgi:hypothetical protein
MTVNNFPAWFLECKIHLARGTAQRKMNLALQALGHWTHNSKSIP